MEKNYYTQKKRNWHRAIRINKDGAHFVVRKFRTSVEAERFVANKNGDKHGS